ncbi:MAG: hypothetical protein HC892_01675 [Saprospiraceae bacterium]|nr:hypothetical protein [Saprospiraceae bacterium]
MTAKEILSHLNVKGGGVKFDNGGIVDSKLIDFKLYSVTVSNDKDTELLERDTPNQPDIDYYSLPDGFEPRYKGENVSIIVWEKTNQYKHVGGEDYPIEDYPIESYYEDKDIYSLIKEDDYPKEVDTKSFDYYNADEVIDNNISEIRINVETEFFNKYKKFIHYSESAGFLSKSFYCYLVMDKDSKLVSSDTKLFTIETNNSTSERVSESGDVSTFENNYRIAKSKNPEYAILCVRISNHTGSERNLADKVLSFVVTSNNKTRGKFDNDENKYSEEEFDKSYLIEKYLLDDNMSESDLRYVAKEIVDEISSAIDNETYQAIIENREEDFESFNDGGIIKKDIVPFNPNHDIKELESKTIKILTYKSDGNTLTNKSLNVKPIEKYDKVYISVEPTRFDEINNIKLYLIIIEIRHANKSVFTDYQEISNTEIHNISDYSERASEQIVFILNRLKGINDDEIRHVSVLELEMAKELGLDTERLLKKRQQFIEKRQKDEQNKIIENKNKEIEESINFNNSIVKAFENFKNGKDVTGEAIIELAACFNIKLAPKTIGALYGHVFWKTKEGISYQSVRKKSTSNINLDFMYDIYKKDTSELEAIINLRNIKLNAEIEKIEPENDKDDKEGRILINWENCLEYLQRKIFNKNTTIDEKHLDTIIKTTSKFLSNKNPLTNPKGVEILPNELKERFLHDKIETIKKKSNQGDNVKRYEHNFKLDGDLLQKVFDNSFKNNDMAQKDADYKIYEKANQIIESEPRILNGFYWNADNEALIIIFNENKNHNENILKASNKNLIKKNIIKPSPILGLKTIEAIDNGLFKRFDENVFKQALKDNPKIQIYIFNQNELVYDSTMTPPTIISNKELNRDKNTMIKLDTKYQLGDMYSHDFDVDGMLQAALKSDISWGVDNLEKLHNSMEDNNYHEISKPLWSAIGSLNAGNTEQANLSLLKMKSIVKVMLDETNEDDEIVYNSGYFLTLKINKGHAKAGSKVELREDITKGIIKFNGKIKTSCCSNDRVKEVIYVYPSEIFELESYLVPSEKEYISSISGKRIGKFSVGEYVTYKVGEKPERNAYGLIKKVVDLETEFAYRVDAYVPTEDGLVFDSERTNEKYEMQLKLTSKENFDRLRREYEKIVENRKKSKEEPKQEAKNTKVMKLNKQQQYELNRQVRELIEKNGADRSKYSEAELTMLSQYSGHGGLKNEYATEIREGKIKNFQGFLFEFYTPELVVNKMWGLAYKHGFEGKQGDKVLEPSCGVGRFIKLVPNGCSVTAFEVDRTSYTIAKVLYPRANVNLKSFETEFFMGSESLGNIVRNKYNLVIGNPPYGKYDSPYSVQEQKHTLATQFDHYFIMRGIDSLVQGGLLIFIIPSAFLQNNNKYNGFKELLSKKAELIDAYRLPENAFDHTAIGTDIIVLRKK